MTSSERASVQSEINRLMSHPDALCRQMVARGAGMFQNDQISAYDEPNAPMNQSGPPGESYGDTHTDINGNAVMHIGAMQRRANGSIQQISSSEFQTLTGHELVHATFGYADNIPEFSAMRQRCGKSRS